MIRPAPPGGPAIRVVPPDDPVAVRAVASYVAELDDRFPGGFEPAPNDPDAASLAPPTGVFVVATSAGEPVACGGVRVLDDGPEAGSAEIKRMWVHPDRRGTGLGSRMLAHLEERAAALGCGRVCLDTHATLVEAIAMYERRGYDRVERYNDNPYAQAFFAKDL